MREVFQYYLLFARGIAEIDILKFYLTLHRVFFRTWIVNVDWRLSINDFKRLVAGSFCLGKSNDVGAKAT